MSLQFKVRTFEIEQGQNEVVLNEESGAALGINHFDRVLLRTKGKKVVAIANFSHNLIKPNELGVFEEVTRQLNLKNGDMASVEPIQRPESLDYIKKKLDGGILTKPEITAIIHDLMQETLSSTELAAFISAIYVRGMNVEETAALTNAICDSGDTLHFGSELVVSSHSIGGVAGDRVSLVIVPILASLGIKIPKTASRAISSASGTADTMEVLCPVSLDVPRIQQVVEKTNGCLVWGGAVRLASADDKLIRIRNPLHLDPKPLLLSSILAKKKAEGAKYVIIDIPVGKGAKIEDVEEGKALAKEFEKLGAHLGMRVQCILSDGSEPLMTHVGPALEAKAVLEALENRTPNLLLEKSCLMAGLVLHLAKGVSQEEGYKTAYAQVLNGSAYEKLQEIILEQGGKRVNSKDIKVGKLRGVLKATESGKIAHVDNKAVSRLCRMLGAPQDLQAGLILKVAKGQHVEKGQEIAELVCNNKEKLAYALKESAHLNVFEVQRIIIDVV